MSANFTDRTATLYGREVYDRSGDKIGTVGQLYTDHTGRPAWASVHTGLFGMNESLVPLNGADFQGDSLHVAYDKSTVKDAPNVDNEADEPLTAEQVGQLYRHYDLGWDSTGTQDYASGYTAGAQHTREGYQGEGYQGDGYQGEASRSDAMTRSEERLNVGTQAQQTGRARLRKYVVTDNVQTTVPVQREEVRLEREPITDANRDQAYSGPDLTQSEHQVTLHAERPVVDKETVPVEQVRLGKETVRDEQTVGGEVRKERIDAELPGDAENRRFA